MNTKQSAPFKRFISTFLLAVLFLSALNSNAQTFTATSYLNNFAGVNVNGGGQQWTTAGIWGSNTLSYVQNNELDISLTQNAWVYVENLFTSTIDITSNKVIQFTAKAGNTGYYMIMQVGDASSHITGTALQAIVPLNTSYTTYSIDFNTFNNANVNFASIKSVRFWIVANSSGSTYATLTNEHFYFNNITLGSGANNTSNNSIDRWTGDAQNVNIYNTNSGNVSLGTNPSLEPNLSTSYYKFTVSGRTNIIGDLNALEIWSPTTQQNFFRHYITFGIDKFSNGVEYGVIGSNEYRNSPAAANSKHLLLQTNTTAGGGNVGIGAFTVAPTAKLSVNSGSNAKAINVVNSSGIDVFRVMNDGKIWATEVKVQLTPFPDYVFDSTYNLMPLDSVSAYIANKGHLPNMPSAEQVDSAQIGLGEMTRLQQEKIEELTLYLLQMDARMKELEARNKALEAEIRKTKN
jgi:hypothetical protein